MHVLPTRPTVFFDVDDTLILFDVDTVEQFLEDAVEFTDEYGKFVAVPNAPIIDKLIQHADQGHVVVVWSREGGAAWAAEVVEKLELESFVTVCMGKPTLYYDDFPGTTFVNQNNWVYSLGPKKVG